MYRINPSHSFGEPNDQKIMCIYACIYSWKFHVFSFNIFPLLYFAFFFLKKCFPSHNHPSTDHLVTRGLTIGTYLLWSVWWHFHREGHLLLHCWKLLRRLHNENLTLKTETNWTCELMYWNAYGEHFLKTNLI